MKQYGGVKQRIGKSPWSRDPVWDIELLDPSEVIALMDACSNPRRRRQYPTGVRNRALIAFVYRTGVRCNEALDMRPEDLYPEKGMVVVRRGKGSKRRIVGMDVGAFEEVDAWLQIRPESEWLFCTLQGGRLDARYARAMLARKKRKAGITRRTHWHGLRHTWAGEAALEGLPIPVIQMQLGHSNPSTTAIYLRAIAPEATVSAVRQREWKARQGRQVR